MWLVFLLSVVFGICGALTEAAILLSIAFQWYGRQPCLEDKSLGDMFVFVNNYYLLLPPSLIVCHTLLFATFDVHFPVVHSSKQCSRCCILC